MTVGPVVILGDFKIDIRKLKELRHVNLPERTLYGIFTEERVIREIRIDEAACRDDSDSRMTHFDVIMPLKLQSTKY